MGVVYKAIDTTLGQDIALKLIRADRSASPAYLERFRREVRLTRLVTHPNVCRVHDLGESAGLLFLSMEWIPGETLRQLLRKAHVLDEDRALDIAEQAARALEAAHGRGILHRDLKPENIMIDERGAVFVMDFGIAVEQGRYEADTRLMGTLPYMSPEQRRNEPLDPRADLYALGLILREMTTGQAPAGVADAGVRRAAGRPVQELIEILTTEGLENRCPSAAAALERIARARAARSPARTARRAWILGGAAITAAVLVWGAYALSFKDSRTFLTQPAPAQAFFETGLALRDTAETARHLDDAIAKFRLGLIEDPDAPLLWAALGEAYAKRYEWNRDTASRDEAMQAIERAFRLDGNLAAAHNARAAVSIAERDYRAAKTELEAALRLDERLDAAWANLGRVLGELGDYHNGLAALRRAITLKPDSFRHHLALGRFFDRAGEYDAAAQEYRRAIELKPDSTMAWNSLGTTALRTERYEDAAAAFRKSIDFEERGTNRSNLGTALYYLKDYGGAAENYRHAARLEPDRSKHWGNAGDALRMMGRTQESLEAYRQAVSLARVEVERTPSDADGRSILALWCARARTDTCDPLAEVERAERAQPDNAEIVFRKAVILCQLSRDDEALDTLERAVRLGVSRAQVQNESDLSRLEGSLRYQRIIALAS